MMRSKLTPQILVSWGLFAHTQTNDDATLRGTIGKT